MISTMSPKSSVCISISTLQCFDILIDGIFPYFLISLYTLTAASFQWLRGKRSLPIQLDNLIHKWLKKIDRFESKHLNTGFTMNNCLVGSSKLAYLYGVRRYAYTIRIAYESHTHSFTYTLTNWYTQSPWNKTHALTHAHARSHAHARTPTPTHVHANRSHTHLIHVFTHFPLTLHPSNLLQCDCAGRLVV